MTIAQQRPTLTQRALKVLVWVLEALTRPIPAPRPLPPAAPAASPAPSLTPAEREAIAVAEASIRAMQVPQMRMLITPPPAPPKVADAQEIKAPSIVEQTAVELPIPAHSDTSKWQPTAPYVTEPAHENTPELELSDRARLVEAALDEAWGNGLKTYPVLIKFVELKTGKGCSRRTIAAWKKSRKLDQADA